MPEEIIQPPRRSRAIDALEAWLRFAWKTGLRDKPVLERQALLDDAAQETALDDFGDEWFIEPLDVLLESLHAEADLNAAGVLAARLQFHKVLKDRLWAQMWFRRHPEILSRPLPHPVIVVGPMRSGTTRMHRLLAADRRFSHLRSFETISPVPRPDFEPGGEDFRRTLAARIMKVARIANPRTLNIHPTGPMEPEEELGLLVNSFWGMKHDAQWRVPSYANWCDRTDPTSAYRQMADLLRLIGWSQQASSLRPWILKTPQHMLDLPALLKIFPDARLIFTHRDPQAVVGSAASLAWNQTIIYTDSAKPEAVGQEWLHKTGKMIARMRNARDTIPRDRMIDVHFDEMDRDWRGVIGRVYEFLDLDIEPAIPGMESYLSRTRDLKRRPHRYSLAEFGLTPEQVEAELGDYVRTYGISVEDRESRAARA